MRIDELKASYDKLGAIYPVLVDKHGEVIDGVHRKKVDPSWKELLIDTDDETVKAIIALVANINRREISSEEITKRVDKIAELTRWKPKRIAAEIGRSEEWVLKYISQKYKDAVKSESGKKGGEASIASRREAKHKAQSIIEEKKAEKPVFDTPKSDINVVVKHENEGEAVDFEEETVTKEEEKCISEIEKNGVIAGEYEVPHPDADKEIEEPKSYLFDYLGNPQFIENVWHSDGIRGSGESIYGDPNFHGNTPPVIIFQCLMKYTKEGDKVLDPMAGSGTTIDICRDLSRDIVAFDIKPLREDIRYGDAIQLELNDESVDFIFCHFPYWDMVQYSDNSADLSNLSLNNYLTKIRGVFTEFKRVLKHGRYCAVLIGDKRKSGLLDLSAHVSLLGSESLKLHDKIIWVAKKQRSKEGRQSNLTKYRAKKFNYHLQTFDTLLIFRKL